MSDASKTQKPPQKPETPEPDLVGDLRDRIGPQLDEMQAQFTDVNEQVKDFIRKNPGTTLLGAAAVGFLIGKWASRR